MQGVTAVVLSDFRPFLVASALQLYFERSPAQIITSKVFVDIRDFGDTTPFFLRRLIFSVLRRSVNLTVARANENELGLASPLGPMSSLVSITNDALATEEKYPNLWREMTTLASAALGVAKAVKAGNYREAVFFNGRVASTRELGLRLSGSPGVDVWAYEWGGKPETYRLFEYPLHDEEVYGAHLVRFAKDRQFSFSPQSSNEFIAAKLASEWTQTHQQKPPITYATVIFLGSAHEYMWTDDGPVKKNWDAHPTELLSAALREFPLIWPVAVRCHPNMSKDPSWLEQFEDIARHCQKHKIDVISPTSRWSSHELITEAELVVVGGSSIILDCYFLGKKARVVGVNRYREIIDVVEKLSWSSSEKMRAVAGAVAGYNEKDSCALKPKFLVTYLTLAIVDRIARFGKPAVRRILQFLR